MFSAKNKLILAVVGIVLGWVMLVPVFEFPDEQAHFGTVTYLIDQGHLPGYHLPDMTREMFETQVLLGILRDGNGNNSYTYHPDHTVSYSNSFVGLSEPDILALNKSDYRKEYTTIDEAARYPALYYAYDSLFVRAVNRADILVRLFLARFGSLLLVAGMALVIWQIGTVLFGKQIILIRTLLLITMIEPMMSFVSAGVNPDNLHNLFFILAMYLCLRVVKWGITLQEIVYLALTLGGDLYTKPQGFITVTIVIAALTLRIVREKHYKLLGWIGLLCAAVVILGWSQFMRYRSFLWISNDHGASIADYFRFSANKLVAQNVVWYWGVFKWLGIVLPPIYWRVANRAVLVSIFGLLIYWWKIWKKKFVVIDPYSVFFLMCASVIYAGAIFWFDWQYVKGWGFSLGIQARYFFPTLVAHMAILLTGILSLGWDKRSRLWLRRGIVILFVWLQLGGIWRLITSYYDTTSPTAFITQASQYKPFFAKGNWWYLWGGVYLISLIYLIKMSLSPDNQAKVSPRQT